MLESLLIKGFQAHRNLEIAFDPNVTTIVGPSDVGKSAIIRALRWVVFNTPRSGFERKGSKKTLVRLTVDGHTITRKRINGKNQYSLDGHIYKAFGTNCPESIVKAINVRDINFQDQHDAPFWFKESAGQVSRQLNEIVNLGVIDSTLSEVNKQLRKSREVVEVTRDRFNTAQHQRDELSWTKDCNADLARVEALQKALAAKRTTAAGLRLLVESCAKAATRHQNATTSLQTGLKAVFHGKRFATLSQQAQLLENLINQVIKAKQLATLVIPDAKPLGKLIKQRDDLVVLLNQITDQENQQCLAQQELANNLQQLEKNLKQRCPVCGQKMSSP